jgi:hypothetical protein
MTPRHARRWLPAAVGVAAFGLVACGVPVDRHPRALPNAAVPFQLVPPAPPTTRRGGHTVSVDIFMVKDDRLVSVPRDVPAPVTLSEVLGALLVGPTPGEAATGMRTAIAGRTSLRGATQDGSVARVNLSNSFVDLEGQEQVAAVAQIVFSATGVPGIDGVTFSLEGRPVEPLTGDGTQINRPLQRSDFPFLFPA